jgi:hypothetical protein
MLALSIFTLLAGNLLILSRLEHMHSEIEDIYHMLEFEHQDTYGM